MHLPGACLTSKKSQIFCTHSEKFAGSEESGFEPKPGLVPIPASLLYTTSLNQVKRWGRRIFSFFLDFKMLSQEPQRQKGSQSEGLAGVTGRWKGVNQEMQTWWRYQPLTQPESSPFPERCGQDPWKTSLALASLVGLSGEGGADNVLLPVSPAPVEQVSPPGSKLFVDSGGLPSDKRKAFSLYQPPGIWHEPGPGGTMRKYGLQREA